jgi:acetyl esterase/lipase
MISQQLQSLIAMVQARPQDPNATVEQMRAYFEMGAELFPLPRDVEVQASDADGVPAEWIDVPGLDPSATILYLHGGGYAIGSLKTHRHLVADLARASGMRGLSVAYRLAPEHPFPAAVDDSVKVYRWLIAQGLDTQRIAIAGDSAGGGLTLATLIALRDAGDELPACAVVLSPWTDLAMAGVSVRTKAAADPLLTPNDLHRYAQWYLGETDPRTPLASPLYGDLSGLPPLLVHVGTAEILLDDSVRLAERARGAGVDVTLDVQEDMVHVWHYFAQLVPEGEASVREVGAFISAHIG